jgi:hypothetical protein
MRRDKLERALTRLAGRLPNTPHVANVIAEFRREVGLNVLSQTHGAPGAHAHGPKASFDAADLIAPSTGTLRARALQAILRANKPLTQAQIDKAVRADGHRAPKGYSSVRTRVSELVEMGWLEEVGRAYSADEQGDTLWYLTNTARHALGIEVTVQQ